MAQPYNDDDYDAMLRRNVMEEMDNTSQAAASPPKEWSGGAFAGGGGPPQPQDPYFGAYQDEHPDYQPGTKPVGSQVNYDNSARKAPAPSPTTQPAPSNGYYRPDGGWQNTGVGGATAPRPAPASTPNAAAAAAPNAGSGSNSLGLSPELSQILEQLRNGLGSPNIPQVSQPSQVTPAYAELLRNSIMQAIQEGQRPVDASDPMVAPMIQALSAQSQRAKEANQGRVSEQLAARHLLNSGAYDTSVERYNQGVDESSATSEAQLMTQVLGQRQQRLMQAIQTGANYLTADQARQLQAALANVNSALTQYQTKSGVGLGLLEALLQNQFGYDQLGLQAGEFASGQNSNALNF